MNRTDIPKFAELLKNGGRCPVCGYLYLKEDNLRYYPPSDNRTRHRALHRQHAPQPESRLTGFPPGDIRVDTSSPLWPHGLVYERAHYLKQQENYFFVQWREDRAPVSDKPKKDIHAILLIEEPQLMERVPLRHWLKQSSSFFRVELH